MSKTALIMNKNKRNKLAQCSVIDFPRLISVVSPVFMNQPSWHPLLMQSHSSTFWALIKFNLIHQLNPLQCL